MESNVDFLLRQYKELLEALRNMKPNDRSEADRYWAIVITDTEKAMAVFHRFVKGE